MYLEQHLNQRDVWNEDERYHVSKMLFNENLAESSKVSDLKKVFIRIFYLYFIHQLLRKFGLMQCFFRD